MNNVVLLYATSQKVHSQPIYHHEATRISELMHQLWSYLIPLHPDLVEAIRNVPTSFTCTEGSPQSQDMNKLMKHLHGPFHGFSPSWRLRAFAAQQFPTLLSLVLPASPSQRVLMNVDDNTDTFIPSHMRQHTGSLPTKGTFTFLLILEQQRAELISGKEQSLWH